MEEHLEHWAELSEHEERAATANADWLAEIEPAIAILHDAPNALTALPGFQAESERLNLAGMCLKRSLDDLRSMWILLRSGYVAEAAAVCADLWEHAMLASCCALSDEIAAQFMKDEPDDFSLGPHKLSSELAQLVGRGLASTHEVMAETLEEWAATSYASYKWLCQVKHPTLRALQFTSGSTVTEAGILGLIARPDTRKTDRSTDGLLVAIAFGVISEATTLFGSQTVGERDSPELEGWKAERDQSEAILKRVVPPDKLRPPWSIADTKGGKRAQELYERREPNTAN